MVDIVGKILGDKFTLEPFKLAQETPKQISSYMDEPPPQPGTPFDWGGGGGISPVLPGEEAPFTSWGEVWEWIKSGFPKAPVETEPPFQSWAEMIGAVRAGRGELAKGFREWKPFPTTLPFPEMKPGPAFPTPSIREAMAPPGKPERAFIKPPLSGLPEQIGVAYEPPQMSPLDLSITVWQRDFENKPSVLPQAENIDVTVANLTDYEGNEAAKQALQAWMDRGYTKEDYEQSVVRQVSQAQTKARKEMLSEFPSEDALRDYLEKTAIAKGIFDAQTGELITIQEAKGEVSTNPNRQVIVSYAMGEGFTPRTEPMSLQRALRMSSGAVQSKFMLEMTKQATAEWQTETARILNTDLPFDEKRTQLTDLEKAYRPWVLAETSNIDWSNVITSTLTQAELRQRAEAGDIEAAMKRGEVQAGVMDTMLKGVGGRILNTWPFAILTETQLRRLSRRGYDMLRRYLQEQGVSLSQVIAPESRGGGASRGGVLFRRR